MAQTFGQRFECLMASDDHWWNHTRARHSCGDRCGDPAQTKAGAGGLERGVMTCGFVG
jgi:hypothetical protein